MVKFVFSLSCHLIRVLTKLFLFLGFSNPNDQDEKLRASCKHVVGACRRLDGFGNSVVYVLPKKTIEQVHD